MCVCDKIMTLNNSTNHSFVGAMELIQESVCKAFRSASLNAKYTHESIVEERTEGL